ncbi:MAG TPA: condensation domain-containing protein [Streptosporangiaceae bacterium]|nr:condensation domain-containing protein [Streptosporangiaceae bacterium]
MADKVLVPFAGEGSGIAELSWGQQVIWRGIEARGAPIWLPGLEPIARGKTVQDVADLLSFLMSRYQSLRTRLLISDDGHVQQVVSSSGEVALDVIETGDDADPLTVAKALQAEWLAADLDFASEWPVKMGVVMHRGVPAYRVTAMCHIVTDGFGVLVMMDESEHLAVADKELFKTQLGPVTRRVVNGPVTAMEPLEQAQWQASPQGKRRSAIAEGYWERLLRTIPPRMFAEPAEPRTPRFAQIRLNSKAAYLAMQSIAARTGADTSPVLLAAFAVALCRVTGVHPAVPRVMVNNRFRSRLAQSVSPIAQTCPCAIDVAGITFDEAVKRAFSASITAFKHAYFEPARIREIVAAVSKERGVRIDLSCVYNDLRMSMPREARAALPGPGDVRAALPLTTVRWEEQTDDDFCHVQIVDNFESPQTLEVLVMTDSEYVSPDEVESVVRLMETLIVEAAFDPDVPTGVRLPG